MILLLLAAMAADLLTFALVVPLVGVGSESNPVMLRAHAAFGLPMVVALKVLLTAVILLLVARVSRPDLRRRALAFGACFGFVGAAANVAAWLVVW